jgi:hypothetical protein
LDINLLLFYDSERIKFNIYFIFLIRLRTGIVITPTGDY